MVKLSLKFGDPLPELAACVDDYRDTREVRLAMQKEVDAVEAREKELRDHLIANLTDDMTGIAGKKFRAQRIKKEVPSAKDWVLIRDYVVENDRFDLLQRRLSDKAVQDLWEAGEEVPGVERFTKIDVSVTKI